MGKRPEAKSSEQTKCHKTSLSPQAQKLLAQINSSTKLGDLRKMAKQIKKNHGLAMELWETEDFVA